MKDASSLWKFNDRGNAWLKVQICLVLAPRSLRMVASCRNLIAQWHTNSFCVWRKGP